MSNSFFILNEIKDHFRRNKSAYIFICVTIIIGVVLGIYLWVSDYSYLSLISSSDKILMDYIKGEAEYFSIFYSRFINVILSFLIVFVLNITAYTSILSFIFVGYQSLLTILTIASVINLYGLMGVLNVIFLILPINIINLIIMSVFLILCKERAVKQLKNKMNFMESFFENNFLKWIIVCLLFGIVLCIISSFILPIFIKSFVIVSF